jgi:4-carboxymuconolactone decarboxylase
MPSSNPRIPPVTGHELDEVAALLPKIVVAGTVTTGKSNVMRTLVRHGFLFERWTPFLDGLLNGVLSPRDRELLVLRTAWNCRSEYEWGQHVVVGRKVALTDEEIRRVPAGPDAVGWSHEDALLLRAADELHHDFSLSDATWAQLADRFDERQLIELPMVVGHYQLMAMVLKSLSIQRDEGLPGFENSTPS